MTQKPLNLFLKTAFFRAKNSFILLCGASFYSCGIISSSKWAPPDATIGPIAVAMLVITLVWCFCYILSETVTDFSLKSINPKYRNFVAIVPFCIPVAFLTLWVNDKFLGASFGWDEFVTMYFFSLTMTIFGHSAQLYGFYWAQQNPTQIKSAFFKRLSVRGPVELLSIEAQDHYLKVATNRSNEMVRASMADATKELKEYAGLRVHRSHWVAIDAIERFVSSSQASYLVLKNGAQIPVSRSYRPKIRELSEELDW